MEKQREFVAVEVPASIRHELFRLQEGADDVRWTPLEQLHLTLRFLGEVPDHLQEPIEERLARVRVEPFILPIEGVGAFPPKGPPRVVWSGTGTGHPRLFQLRQQIDDALLGARLDLDVRTFHAHVTLGRCGPDAARPVKSWLLRHAEFAAAAFRVDAFGLYASVLHPGGAEHRLIRRFSLAPVAVS